MPRSGYKAIFVPFTRGVRLMAPGSAIIDATSIRSKSPSGNLLAYPTTKSDREFHGLATSKPLLKITAPPRKPMPEVVSLGVV